MFKVFIMYKNYLESHFIAACNGVKMTDVSFEMFDNYHDALTYKQQIIYDNFKEYHSGQVKINIVR